MKTFKLFFILLIVIVCAACSETGEAKPSTEIKIEKSKEENKQKSSKKNEKPETTEETKSITRKSDQNLDTVQKEEFSMDDKSCKTDSLVAPTYADDKRIIFLSYGEEQEEDRIYEYSTKTKQCGVLYQAKGIGNITGHEGKLFWPEYNTKQLSNVDWKIKSLDLLNKEVKEISSGGSYKDTPTPTIKSGVNSVNWIEYSFKGDVLISTLVEYDLTTSKTTKVSEVILDESAERTGEYYIQQQSTDVKGEFLLYKSIFNDKGKEFNISLQQGKSSKKLLNQNAVLDFVSNDTYFVYTGEGHLTVLDINKPKNRSVFTTGNKLTTDTPIFLSEDTLVFRYAMNEILLVDLKSHSSYSLTGYTDLVSKPIYTNGLLAYGIKSTQDEKETITFYLVKIEEK